MPAESPEIPAPPWRRSRPAGAAKRPLSQDMIIDAALVVLDREGLDAVSMRRVAEELGTGAASLYAHVANKDELLELAYDRILGEIRLPAEPDPDRWQEQIREIARESYRVLGAHGDIARVSLANVPTGPNALRVSEAMLGVLITGGVPPQLAAWAVDRIALYLSADAYEGALYQARQRAMGASPEQFIAEYFGQLHGYLASLPPERFPFLSKHVDALVQGDGDQRFEFGLDMLIGGLVRLVPQRD
ncbi:TetR/AcrR family transcriptional regulator C-terminal domain-containing protein [Catellatospora tritici]|uniref:TetR/AcrR family transcriptional regulator C-terminal domain-containing protein n=1 Tax=Catellatospora tritici TaxID=2851566 RepID=UPI001C2D34C9|nr:TetR/AcrR family transcriptional regulator C-terminal domain-containing protein [Catellatospora tritici]MBV1848912.1 TetR/AcrR family transcriptional regulator C-terminal domain-containing protein [Catellatospora tritici]